MVLRCKCIRGKPFLFVFLLEGGYNLGDEKSFPDMMLVEIHQ